MFLCVVYMVFWNLNAWLRLLCIGFYTSSHCCLLLCLSFDMLCVRVYVLLNCVYCFLYVFDLFHICMYIGVYILCCVRSFSIFCIWKFHFLRFLHCLPTLFALLSAWVILFCTFNMFKVLSQMLFNVLSRWLHVYLVVYILLMF